MKRSERPTWFKEFLSRYKRSVACAVALGIIASGCSALLMFTSGYLISATAMPGITLFAVMIPVACVQLFGFGRPLARYLERLISHDWVLKVTSDLRRMLFWGVEKRSGNPALKRAVGEYLGLLSDDIAHLQNLYLRVVFPTAIALLLALCASVFFGWFSLPFALVMILVFILSCAVLPWASLLATRALTMQAKASKAAEYADLTDDVLGAADWVLSMRSDDVVSAHSLASRSIRRSEASARARQRALSLASTLILGAAACLVVAWSGLQFGSGVAPNLIAAFTLGFFPLLESFAVLPAAVSQAPVHSDALSRLDEYVANPDSEEPTLPEDRIPPAGTRIGESPLSGGCSILVENVSYTYPGARRPALDNLTLRIAQGSKVAMLGRSGSGKSTLADIMRGALEPSAGFSATNATVGYLGQTPYLFNRSLRENLTLNAADVDDQTLLAALAGVGLGGKVESLSSGLDTVIGETGTGFSGGEAHRIALARVIAADAPIVIVDEPFAALDPQTESDLLDALFETCAERTLVVITHHLAQIERFDRVVFVEDGEVELDGSPADLMRDDAQFSKLVAFDRATGA